MAERTHVQDPALELIEETRDFVIALRNTRVEGPFTGEDDPRIALLAEGPWEIYAGKRGADFSPPKTLKLIKHFERVLPTPEPVDHPIGE
jgi:hypothetical protein